jgi:hypothetical protein
MVIFPYVNVPRAVAGKTVEVAEMSDSAFPSGLVST